MRRVVLFVAACNGVLAIALALAWVAGAFFTDAAFLAGGVGAACADLGAERDGRRGPGPVAPAVAGTAEAPADAFGADLRVVVDVTEAALLAPAFLLAAVPGLAPRVTVLLVGDLPVGDLPVGDLRLADLLATDVLVLVLVALPFDAAVLVGLVVDLALALAGDGGRFAGVRVVVAFGAGPVAATERVEGGRAFAERGGAAFFAPAFGTAACLAVAVLAGDMSHAPCRIGPEKGAGLYVLRPLASTGVTAAPANRGNALAAPHQQMSGTTAFLAPRAAEARQQLPARPDRAGRQSSDRCDQKRKSSRDRRLSTATDQSTWLSEI